MRRLTATTFVLLCLAGTVVAAPSGAAESRTSGWAISRTGRGGAVLTGTFTGSALRSTATAVLFAVSGSGPSRRSDGAFTTARIDWGADGWPRVYGGVQPSCPAACATPVGTPFSFGFSSNGHLLDATVYVATQDMADVAVSVTSPGWRVRPWRPSMRTVTSDEAGAVGVRALHTTIGEFTGAEAPGGRHGSIGWGDLPCDNQGEGRARFTGGRWSIGLDCAGRTSGASHTGRATTWRLAGRATGVGSAVNVLVVVDFPPER